MDPLDYLVPYYRKFNALPFLVQRALLIVLFLACFVVGVKLFPYSEHLGGMFLIICQVGLVWATDLWHLGRPLFKAFVIYLRIFH
jgi:hypothetical protein